MDAAADPAKQEADGVAADAQARVSKPSVPARCRGDCPHQSNPARLGALLCGRPLQPVFLVHSRLGGEEDSDPPGARAPASRVRLEAVEQRVVVWEPRPFLWLPGRPLTVAGQPPLPTGPITLAVNGAGARSAVNPHAAC